jgi:hypothetical protein
MWDLLATSVLPNGATDTLPGVPPTPSPLWAHTQIRQARRSLLRWCPLELGKRGCATGIKHMVGARTRAVEELCQHGVVVCILWAMGGLEWHFARTRWDEWRKISK